MATFDEFWDRSGPGMLGLGVGLYNRHQAEREARKRLAGAQGPLFQSAMTGAQGMLGQLGALNPDALAADRFNAQEALLAGPQAKDLADLQRTLYAKGMLGTANYNPGIEGIEPGMLMNPHMAAFYAARNADRAKRAAGALDQGQRYADNLVTRASNLQGLAGNTQGTGLAAARTQSSRAYGNAKLLKGAMGILKDNPKILSRIGGMLGDVFGGVGDWLGGLFSPDFYYGDMAPF